MLEGVHPLRKEVRLIEEFGPLELGQTAVQRLWRHVGNRLQQGERHLRPDDRGGLQEPFGVRRQPVDACRQHGLHRRWHRNVRQGPRQPVGAGLPSQDPGFHQGAHALFQKERVPLRALDQESFERCQTGVVSQQGLEEGVGARRGERVEPHLGIVRLTAPAVLVLRAVVDQQQEAGRWQALDQVVQQGLGLGIDPVQVLTDQEQGLHLALAQQHAFERLEGTLAALRGLERAKGTVVGQGVQQPEEGRNGLLERLVQRQHLPGDPGPHGTRLIRVLDVDVALEQVNDRKVGRRLAVGHRGTLQHPPALRVVGVDTLVHQAGLAHPGLPHYRHDLAVARAGLLQRLAHGGEFRLAPDKAGEAPCGSGLEASTEGARSDQLEHLYRLWHAPDRDGSQRLHLHQALDQPEGCGGQTNRPGRGQLLHACRQMRRLSHRRVVHVQIVTNGPHHHFSGVQSHPDTHLDAVGAAHRLGILAHGRLHGQGGVAGAAGRGPHGPEALRRGP